MNTIAGQIYNVFSNDELEKLSSGLNACDRIVVNNNECHGVSEGHLMYNWFIDNCFSRVQDALDNYKMKLIFGMFLNEQKPWGIHTDAYHVQNFTNRKYAYSILMPLSVDSNPLLVNECSTIVFNESAENENELEQLPIKTDGTEVTDEFHQKYISHASVEQIKRLSVLDAYHWERGSLIYWKSQYYHSPDNFFAKGFNSKQAIVMHTYYDT